MDAPAGLSTLATALHVKTDDAVRSSPDLALRRPKAGLAPTLGEAALPADWTSIVEGRDTILQVADDFVAAYDLTSRYPSG